MTEYEPSVLRRLWSRVDKSGDCWVWRGGRIPSGYGVFTARGRTSGVHRFAYEIFYGPIKKGLSVCHRCDNRSCLKPEHLFLGSQADNVRDSVSKGRWRTWRFSQWEMQEIFDRYAQGQTQASLAETFGTSQTVISNLITGKSKPPPHLDKLDHVQSNGAPLLNFFSVVGHTPYKRKGFLQRSYERLSSEVLDAASAPVRLQVLKLLSSKGPLPYTEIMHESKLDPVRDAGKFVYHLKTLRKAGLVKIEKGTKKYEITELGKVLVEFSRDLEEYLATKKGRLFVRTSRMTIEEFDRTRIANSLVKEAGMPQSLSNEIATEAEDRLLRIGTSYLTAPLIRELVNTILVERRLDEYRHKLTRLGLPVNDVTVLLEEASQKRFDPGWVEKAAGTAVTEEYVLLNSLPRDLVDAHLTGQIHLDEPDSWILKPSKFFHDSRLLFQKGLPGTGPPQSFESALAQILKLVRIGEGEVSSEQIFDHFNVYLSPFLKDTPIERVQETVRLFLNMLNWDGFSNNVPPRFTLGLDFEIPEELEAGHAIGSSGKKTGTYRDHQETSQKILKVVLEATLEISRSSLFLNPGIVIRPGRSKDEESDDILRLAYENSVKNGSPNYHIVKDQTSASSDGSLMETVRKDGTRIASGSVLGTVLVNLPRAAYDADGRDDRLLQNVMLEARHAVHALELRRQTVKKRLEEGLLPLFAWHPDGGTYYNDNGTSAEVGLLGLYEMIAHHAHAPLEEKDSMALVKRVVDAVKKAVEESKTERGLSIRVGLHGSPEASSRLAQVDAEKYGFSTIVYQGSKKLPYYTDMPALPPTRKIPLDRRVTVEGEVQRLIDGDGLVPLSIGQKTGVEGLSQLSRRLAERGTTYYSYTRIVSHCLNCQSTLPSHRTHCENCGSDRIVSAGRSSGRMLPLETWPVARSRDLDHLLEYEIAAT